MKRIKKLCSLLLAMIMVLAMAVPALAAGDGSITVTNATAGKTYTAYKIFDAGLVDEKIVYTASYAVKDWFEKQDGNPFTFWKIGTEEDAASSYNVQIAEDTSNEEVIAFLQKYVADSEGQVNVTLPDIFTESDQLAESETVTFDNLEYGYYLVTSSLGSIISVDSTKPSVRINDKNSGPNWDGDGKTITNGDDVNSKTQSSANFGDTINFQISVDAVNYDGAKKITQYQIKDILSKGLTYVTGTDEKVAVTVKVGNKELAAEEFTLNMTQGDPDVEGDSGFEITIDWTNDDGSFKYDPSSQIVVTYSAKLNENADIAGDGNGNKAVLTYTTDDGKTNTGVIEKETTTYTYALAIKKIDPKGNALAGAKFTVSLGNTPIHVKATAEEGVYEYDTEGVNTEVVSPDSGLIVIKGVKAGTYTITETEAPAGYNKLTKTETITAAIDKTETYTTTITTHYDKDGNVTSVVEDIMEEKDTTTLTPVPVVPTQIVNQAGTVLPSTGGMGTRLFYLVGGILVVAAGVLLVSRKRMEREN